MANIVEHSFYSSYFKLSYPLSDANVKMATYEELESSDAPFEIDSNGVKLFMENLTYSYPIN